MSVCVKSGCKINIWSIRNEFVEKVLREAVYYCGNAERRKKKNIF